MTLFITSSPFIDGADRAILSPANDFVERMRDVLPPNPRALFICSDPDSHNMTCHFGADTVAAFSIAGMAFSAYHVLDGYNADEAGMLIQNSDILILAGGHVPTQNAFFREIQLAELLEDYSGVVLGISAGSMNMARIVYAQPEEKGESRPSFRRFLPGLGLTEVNILPHYQKVKDTLLDGKRLYEDITFADSYGKTFYALPDNSYFYQDDDQLLLCGKAYRIRNGILELLTRNGETLDIKKI